MAEVPDIALMPPEQVEGLARMALGNGLGFNLGPWIIGVVFDCMAFGILIHQYQVWWTYSKDSERSIMSWLTHYVTLNQIGRTAYIIYFGMHYFVYNFGRFAVFLDVKLAMIFPTWGWSVSGPIKFFYIHRTWQLNDRNWFLAIFLSALNLAECGMCIFLTWKFSTLSSGLEAAKMTTVTQVWQGMSLGSDVMITTSIAYALIKSKTGWSQTDALIKRLVLITIETQLGPTILMLAFTIQFAIAPPAALSQFFDLLIPKAYAIGYFATLNSRYLLRRAAHGSSDSRDPSSKHIKSNTFAMMGSNRLHQDTVHVEVDNFTESHSMPQLHSKSVNRDFKDINEDSESIENLDYATNLSKRNLNNLA
ncbi:hypothetical protein I204_03575 [Kwoniella mangroviensis CBS 8886]|nr:hypothetical protein I204_03575 [Kwoniella mangroviensis CBS 8886]